MRSKLVVAIVVGLVCTGGAAMADETAPAAAPRSRVVLIPGIKITLKPQRPLAVVDLSRSPEQLGLPELRQPLLGRIEKAIDGAPF